MGNTVQRECFEESPLCSCLSNDEAGTSEIALAPGTSTNYSNPRTKTGRSSSKKHGSNHKSSNFSTRGRNVGTTSKLSESIDETRLSTASNHVYREKASENISDAKTLERENDSMETRNVQKGDSSGVEIINSSYEHEDKVDVSDILTILQEPHSFQRQLISQIFQSWDKENSGLSLDQLKDARQFLLNYTCLKSDEQVDDLIFQSLDQDNAVLRENSFISIVEKKNIDYALVQEKFGKIEPQEEEANEKLVPIAEIKKVLRALGKDTYGGNWLDENMWDFILDQLCHEVDFVSLEKFIVQNDNLAILLRCLSIMQSNNDS